jgi:hypothetical protein
MKYNISDLPFHIQNLILEYYDGIDDALDEYQKYGKAKGKLPLPKFQHPSVFGASTIPSMPWWTIPRIQSIIKDNSDRISQDFINIRLNIEGDVQFTDTLLTPDNKLDHLKFYSLMEEGIWNEKVCRYCKHAISVISNLPSFSICESIFGSVYFVSIPPGAYIKADCGVTNLKLRIQIPINLNLTSDDSIGYEYSSDFNLTVRNVSREYQLGSCFIFDDSYMHSINNQSSNEKVLLVFDIWHPKLSRRSIEKLLYYFNPLCSHGIYYLDPELIDKFSKLVSKEKPLFRIAIVGNQDSGKVSFVDRYCDKKFTGYYNNYPCPDFKVATRTITNKPVNLQLWMLPAYAGSYRLRKDYYRVADLIFLFVDTTMAFSEGKAVIFSCHEILLTSIYFIMLYYRGS